MHTPGPWIASNVNSPAEDIATAIWQNDGTADYWERTSQIGECHYYEKGDEEFQHQDARLISVDEARANARLIAAAPEMLESLLKVQTDLQRSDFVSESDRTAYVLAYVRAAITKATGR